MGTSLSGLTPATTFDGLLKTSDNEPLDGTLKAISTGDGTDTILQLSNSALSIGGDVTITGTTSDNTASALKVNDLLDSALFSVNNVGQVNFHKANWYTYTAGPSIIRSTNNGGFRFFTGGDAMEIQSTGVGIGTNSPTAKAHIKGSGTTSATTSLLVQNSAGTDALKVTDDGKLTLGAASNNAYINLIRGLNGARIGYIEGQGSGVMISMDNNSNQLFISNNGVGIGETTPTARLHVKGDGNDNTTTSLLVQNSDGTDMLEVDDSGNVGIGSPNPLSATLHISSQSYFNNTTALRIQNSIGNNLFRVRGDGTTDIVNNKYIFNQSGVSTGGAIFKGSGATSATTALLVQNSAGSELLKVRDDGSVFSNGGGAKISSNTGFGQGVLASVTTANNTSAFGVGALQAVTTGVSNTGLGWRAGYSTTGSNNAFVGLMAGYTNSSGSNNTGLGTRVLYDNATGSDNTAVGFRADSDGFSGSVILGKDATATADNQFVVGSSGINAGTVANIGDPNPTHTWEVVINGTKYRILLQEVV